MARTDPPTVSDAGPIIHLDELGCLDLLEDLAPIQLPREVWAEIVRHRPHFASGTPPVLDLVNVATAPSPRLLALANSLALDAGERAALSLSEQVAARLFLCDDAAARLAAESLGYTVHGTIGILIRAIRKGTRTREQILELLRDLPQRSTLHISRQLLTTVIEQVERDVAGA